MPNRVCVIDMPGLSRNLLREVPDGSALGKWLANKKIASLTPSFPAVTCSVQATLTTGVNPSQHGIVANGIATFRSPEDQKLVDATNFAEYRRQVSFWEQSNQFLEARRFWQDADGKSRWKTALLFFQHSMPGFAGTPKPAADVVLTPKPDHGPDGKLVSLCWSEPRDLVPRLFKELGPFPLMNYWGPMAGIASSQWIGRAASIVWREHSPQLQWVYIPHLDYDLQRFGPDSPQATSAVRDAAAAVEPIVAEVLNSGGRLVLLSEYAMRPVNQVIHPNILLREAGLLTIRKTPDGELVDCDRSSAFAMVDHQIAHVFARNPDEIETFRRILNVDGVAAIHPLSPHETTHRRGGNIVLIAKPNAWFDYRWWNTPQGMPAFAKTIDIHRKPGYDPMELFWDRSTNGISQNVSVVKGSHGIAENGESIFASDWEKNSIDSINASDVSGYIESMLNG